MTINIASAIKREGVMDVHRCVLLLNLVQNNFVCRLSRFFSLSVDLILGRVLMYTAVGSDSIQTRYWEYRSCMIAIVLERDSVLF